MKTFVKILFASDLSLISEYAFGHALPLSRSSSFITVRDKGGTAGSELHATDESSQE